MFVSSLALTTLVVLGQSGAGSRGCWTGTASRADGTARHELQGVNRIFPRRHCLYLPGLLSRRAPAPAPSLTLCRSALSFAERLTCVYACRPASTFPRSPARSPPSATPHLTRSPSSSTYSHCCLAHMPPRRPASSSAARRLTRQLRARSAQSSRELTPSTAAAATVAAVATALSRRVSKREARTRKAAAGKAKGDLALLMRLDSKKLAKARAAAAAAMRATK